MSRLTGNRALIIGAGSGIGRGVHEAFLAEGANVGALEIDPRKCEALVELSDGPVICGDATSAQDNDAAVAVMLDAFGGLDTLVGCVGLFDYYLGLADLPHDVLDEAFTEVMNVNVRSMLLAVRAAIEPLSESRGSIILTGSTSSFMPGRGGILYVASKFAVRGCVMSLAHELAPEIRVNGVAPGGTHSTDLRGLRSLGLHDRSLGQEPDRAESIRQRSPLDVALGPADHAESYVFLASEASRGMTGRFIHSDGGANIS
ncbi:3-(cis-5,6-dihydroxycyclohexa-1,3-dien-1-yl)propanoate dehydrogenase [Candidatus Poriferisodalis sp.]|uniref:3-(cis-5,6-dihydroxycyclohexa-1, 3-dien-1-yl)propanoate dehydrogenase n=1 Tax=Candidatus Poriferisodalis sp. TaxID=3101277 RepID=UPI003B59F254